MEASVRTFYVVTTFLALLLIGIYPDQFIPLAVATVAGMLVVTIQRLTR